MELCHDEQDSFINLTTVYPSFIQTRQEIANMLDVVGDVLPRLDPAVLAKQIVEGVLKNQMTIYEPTLVFVVAKLIPCFPYAYCKKTCHGFLKDKKFKFMDNGL
jgi:hypothetical protein